MLKGIFANYLSFYFIGIGGVSMSSLAKFLFSQGKKVEGSDVIDSVFTDELRNLGIRVSIGEFRESIKDFDVIVYTDAVRENDVQLCEAKKLGKTMLSRGQLLYEISNNFKAVIAVSGCHGKTTCTSMLAHVFKAANKKFGAHIGGRDLAFGNYFCNGFDYFITEACEYKKNFLKLRPDIAVILSSRADHLECYGSEEELKKCYADFAESASVKVSLYGDINVGGLTFGFDKNADYSARHICEENGRYSFTVYEGDCELGKICLNVYGKHNILNALAATAVARSAQIAFKHIQKGLSDFKGVERRFENIGNINGAVCIADYAHHPDEIRASLRAAKKITTGRLFVVFQPHTYSRTKNLFGKFVAVLSSLNNLLIYRTYAAREYYDDAGSALTLSQSVKKSSYGDSEQDIKDFILKASAQDTVLFLGAGDIYDIAKAAIKSLS